MVVMLHHAVGVDRHADLVAVSEQDLQHFLGATEGKGRDERLAAACHDARAAAADASAPTADGDARAAKYSAANRADAATGTGDVAWLVLASTEFLFSR